LILRANIRFWLRHPTQIALALLGIALGVAAIVAIDLSEQNARRAMSLSIQAINGQSTHYISGGPTGVSEELYADLRMRFPRLHALPVIIRSVRAGADSRLPLQLLATDLLEATAYGTTWHLDASSKGASLITLLNQKAAALSPQTAAQLGVTVGDTLRLHDSSAPVDLLVAGMLTQTNGALADGLLVTDISTAQEIFATGPQLSRIDLILENETDHYDVAKWLPAGLQLVTAQSGLRATEQLSAAFHLNLKALSLLALLMGVFLIYSTQNFLAVQRASLFANLRCVGTTRRQLAAYLFTEALLLAIVGSLLGLAFGAALATALIRVVSTSVSDLYYQVLIAELHIPSGTLIRGIVAGIGTTLIASAIPIIDAGSIAPCPAALRSMRDEVGRGRIRLALIVGLLLMLSGAAILNIGSSGVWAGFAGLFVIVLGCLLGTPWLLRAALSGLLGLRLRSWPLIARYALRTTKADLGRTAVALMAMTLAIATAIGIALMINSFRISVDRWLQQRLRADLYVSSGDEVSQELGAGLPSELVLRIERLPGVRTITSARWVTLESGEQQYPLVAYDLHREAFAGFQFLRGTADDIWRRWQNEDVAIISEPYAIHQRLEIGAQVVLPGDAGPVIFTITGIYRDYGSDRGVIAISRDNYLKHWHDQRLSGIGVYLHDEIDPNRISMAIAALDAPPSGALQIRSNTDLRTRSMRIFDRTFTVTEVLRILAALIAFLGLLSSLLAVNLERAHEIAVLRSIGLTPKQVQRLTLLQSSLAAGLAGVLAIPLGVLMSTLLITIINVRSFGWSMNAQVDIGLLCQGVLIAVAAGALAGWYPGYRAAHAGIAESLRTE
jgi:putative ABC transport system permease protein